MSVSQKDAVYGSVISFLKDKGVDHEDGDKVELNKDERKTVVEMLIEATKAGIVEVKSEKASADLPNYWNGTLSNWLRKDKRLNGNETYVTKNPGSRAGAGDDQLKEMKKLLVQVTATGNAENIEAVQQAIDARQAEIAAEKVAELEIDMDKIPEALRSLIA